MSGLENEDQAAGGEGEGEKKELRCEILACQEKSGLADKVHEDWCQEVVENGFGPRESVEVTSRCRCANGKTDVEEADDSSSKKEVGFALTFPGSEQSGR